MNINPTIVSQQNSRDALSVKLSRVSGFYIVPGDVANSKTFSTIWDGLLSGNLKGIPKSIYIKETAAMYAHSLIPLNTDIMVIEMAMLLRTTVSALIKQMGIEIASKSNAFMCSAMIVLCPDHPISKNIRTKCLSNKEVITNN